MKGTADAAIRRAVAGTQRTDKEKGAPAVVRGALDFFELKDTT